MGVKIETIEQSFENNGLKCLVHGLAGIGKTVLCATTGAPTLVINCEGGTLSLKNAVRNGLITQEQMDMVRVVKVKTLAQLREVYDMLFARKIPCVWVALDSITEIAEVILANAKKEDKDPRKSYGKLFDDMLQLIKDFRDLPHYNVLMTCKQISVTDGLTNVTSYVPSMPGQKLTPQIPYLFDEVFAMREVNIEVDEGKYEMRRALQTSREMQYEAKDRSGCLNLYEPPNMQHIFEKIFPTMGELVKNDFDETVAEIDAAIEKHNLDEEKGEETESSEEEVNIEK